MIKRDDLNNLKCILEKLKACEPNQGIHCINTNLTENEFKRLSDIFENLNCAKYIEYDNAPDVLSPNIKVHSIDFDETISAQEKNIEKTEIEINLAKSNIEANELNIKNSKSNKLLTIINIIMGVLNLGLLAIQIL